MGETYIIMTNEGLRPQAQDPKVQHNHSFLGCSDLLLLVRDSTLSLPGRILTTRYEITNRKGH